MRPCICHIFQHLTKWLIFCRNWPCKYGIQRFSHLEIPTRLSNLTCTTILIPTTGKFFDTIFHVDYLYYTSTYVPDQRSLIWKNLQIQFLPRSFTNALRNYPNFHLKNILHADVIHEKPVKRHFPVSWNSPLTDKEQSNFCNFMFLMTY